MKRAKRGQPAPEPADDAIETGSPLIVIGASAGGIENLSEVFADLPAALGGAIIVAQHLSPTRPSLLASIFKTSLLVKAATDRLAIRPGTIYVAPADRDVLVEGARLRVVASTLASRSHPSLDRLFETAARSAGPRVLGIVLSGTGSDGAKGLQAIKAAGGTTASITLGSAHFPEMPRAARAATKLDHIVPVSHVAGLIVEFCEGRLVTPSELEKLDGVLDTLRHQCGREFGDYKPGTIQRRTRHRMANIGVATVPEYVKRLESDPAEARALVRDLQISVTRFFRDPKAWTSLRNALKESLSRKDPKEPIRIWSTGCATGEEPYSIALLLASLDVTAGRDVKIYATDTDTTALETARRGIYPAKVLRDIPRGYRKWFERTGDEVKVQKGLRRWLIFGVHDVSKNPPIAKLDLLVCRNVLIYFNQSLQGRVFQLFRHALRPDGVLFLGKSEVPHERELFVPVDTRWRIYSRNPAPQAQPSPTKAAEALLAAHLAAVTPGWSATKDGALIHHAMDVSRRGLEEIRLYDELLLSALPSAIVAVDAQYKVTLWSGAAERIFSLSTREILGKDFFHGIPGLPYPDLKKAIDSVLADEQRQVSLPLIDYLRDDQRSARLRATITRVGGREGDPVATLVLDDVTEIMRLGDAVAEANSRLDAANKDLLGKNDLLQTTKEELETANEELQATIEELETGNEEHQATNEELETTNEELQATNEELEATNAEAETSNQELERRSTALQNMSRFFEDLLQSVDAGVFALGLDRRIQHANKLGLDLLGAPKGSSQLPFDAMKLGWQVEDVGQLLDRVESDEEIVRLRGVAARRKRRLDVTIAPLRDHQSAFAGFLVSLVDVTGGHFAAGEMARRRTEVDEWFESISTPFVVLGPRFEIVAANTAAREQLRFRVEPVGLKLDDLAHGTRVVETGFEFPSLVQVRQALARGRVFHAQVREAPPGTRVFDADFSPVHSAEGDSSAARSLLVLHEVLDRSARKPRAPRPRAKKPGVTKKT